MNDTALAGGLTDLMGLVAACTVLECIGSFGATIMRIQKTSEPGGACRGDASGFEK
jgi:hypothetical protein